MSAPLFFVDRQDLLAGDRVIVSGAEGRHAVTVARLQHGERVDLGDGAGLLVAGQVIRAQAPDLLEVQVLERIIAPDPDPRLVVVQALPKGDRGELAVELLTEVGVDAIVPWAAARSIAQWRGDRGERSLHKWRDAARAAGKPVLIDPKGSDYSRYSGATVITPNRAELQQVIGSWSSEDELRTKAHALRDQLGLDAVLLNSAVAQAREPVGMARAFGQAVAAGRGAWVSGLMPQQDFAVASTPVSGHAFLLG